MTDTQGWGWVGWGFPFVCLQSKGVGKKRANIVLFPVSMYYYYYYYCYY